MAQIHNPILRGFHPDPSICRVGDDYFIATSTFEWFPGVQISHSRDLVHWRTVGQALTRASQLDMRGNPDSCGVWAPSLSHDGDRFWLVYTDVKRLDGSFKDAHNYIVTADRTDGPWSDPFYVNSSGFDPSLYHDDDGRKWFLNMVWDHRAAEHPERQPQGFFAGILLQEWDADVGKLTGAVTNIFRGSDLGLVEAPHLFKRDGWYYLTTAEGGTGYEHAVTHARSRTITGPYEMHPDTHLLTVRDDAHPLQRTGHGQYFETPDGAPWHSYLCTRPLPGTRISPMGRETGLARCEWGDDGWLRLTSGGVKPPEVLEAPDLPEWRPDAVPDRHDFDGDRLPVEFQWLRTPYPERIMSMTAAPSALRLYGRESPGSWFEQALVARRQTGWRCRAATEMEFSPESFQQMAGLIAYYNRTQFHYLCVTADDHGARVLTILTSRDWPEGGLRYPMTTNLPLEDGPLRLGLESDGAGLQFRYDASAGWKDVGPRLDATILSDEGVRGEHSNFTGTFIGMAAHDLTGRGLHADFHWFELENTPSDRV